MTHLTQHTSYTTDAPRARRGMSLVEVIVSLGILCVVLLALGLFSARFAHATSTSQMRIAAGELASDWLDSAKSAPRYTAVESLYVGTATNIKDYPGYTRQTWVTRTGGSPSDTIDYKTVTVQVSNPQMGSSVRKTTVIAPF